MGNSMEDSDVYEVVCAWCGEFLSGAPGAEMVSHGICDRCVASEVDEIVLGVPHAMALLDDWVDIGGEG